MTNEEILAAFSVILSLTLWAVYFTKRKDDLINKN
jgi:hypothetical protein